MAKEQKEARFVFSTKVIDEITEKQRNGFILKRHENPWFNNEYGIRREHLSFSMTDHEYMEYIKCKTDVHYFANTYCQIKLEDGSTGQLVLRDYQKDILDLYANNRFSILMASRQVGKCFLPSTEIEIMSNDHVKKIKMYQFLYKNKKHKTFFDFCIFCLYFMIDKLS